MTIETVSSSTPQQEVKPVETVTEETASAPAAVEAPEQKQSSDSDTEETEEKQEAKDESEDDAESDDEEESKDDAKDKPRRNNGFKKRIAKLTREKAAARAEIEHWKAMALKGAGESPKQEKPEVETKPKASQDGKPDPDSFENHLDYVEALADWKFEQREKAKQEQEQKTRLLSEQERVIKSHTERVKSFAEKIEDFHEALESVDHIHTSPAFEKEIIESEHGPALIYELAKNPEELERLQKLSPTAVARELGRMESRILAKASEEKKPEPKKLTKAPKPITPVSSASSSVAKPLHEMDYEEYKRARAAQMKSR